jgi:short-subunit dehydrogenase
MMSKGKRMMSSPEKVVDYSLKSLKKNKIVCMPGMMNRVMARFFPMLPKRMYYWLLLRMTTFK